MKQGSEENRITEKLYIKQQTIIMLKKDHVKSSCCKVWNKDKNNIISTWYCIVFTHVTSGLFASKKHFNFHRIDGNEDSIFFFF